MSWIDKLLDLLREAAIPLLSGIAGAFIGMAIMRALGLW